MLTAFILINVEVGKETQVFEALMKMDDIQGVRLVFGEYDILARVETTDLNNLINTMIERIRATPGIARTTTLIATEGR